MANPMITLKELLEFVKYVYDELVDKNNIVHDMYFDSNVVSKLVDDEWFDVMPGVDPMQEIDLTCVEMVKIAPTKDEPSTYDIEKFYKEWKGKQTTVTFVVKVPKGNEQEAFEYIMKLSGVEVEIL